MDNSSSVTFSFCIYLTVKSFSSKVNLSLIHLLEVSVISKGCTYEWGLNPRPYYRRQLFLNSIKNFFLIFIALDAYATGLSSELEDTDPNSNPEAPSFRMNILILINLGEITFVDPLILA